MFKPKSYSVGDSTDISSLKDSLRRYRQKDIRPFTLGEEKREESLVERCVHLIAKNFNDHPVSEEEVPPEEFKMICEELTTNLDPVVGAQYVGSEEFWKVSFYCQMMKFGCRGFVLSSWGGTSVIWRSMA